ncbi:MAG: hypothetical protein GKS02_09930 [Alphaproteobacteria bacterium]|nr:hypothetical protein [Alphaproteobacteria bacterium]
MSERASQNQKIFCIGRNKTGTTSLGAALQNAGLTLGSQNTGESLVYDWAARKFDRIVEFARSAQAFQDVPFSLPYTYQILDHSFPGSKFILSVRDNEDQWYASAVRFHTKIIGQNRIPTADDLKNFMYHHQGYVWDVTRLTYGINEETLYDEKIFKSHYLRHNYAVREYFRYRPRDLLVINLADDQAEARLGSFLGLESFAGILPHLNKS